MHTLRAVTCPLFSSNSMHAAIIIFITIVLTACLLLLLTLSSLLFYTLRCQKKKFTISSDKLKESLKVLTVNFVLSFDH